MEVLRNYARELTQYRERRYRNLVVSSALWLFFTIVVALWYLGEIKGIHLHYWFFPFEINAIWLLALITHWMSYYAHRFTILRKWEQKQVEKEKSRIKTSYSYQYKQKHDFYNS